MSGGRAPARGQARPPRQGPVVALRLPGRRREGRWNPRMPECARPHNRSSCGRVLRAPTHQAGWHARLSKVGAQCDHGAGEHHLHHRRTAEQSSRGALGAAVPAGGRRPLAQLPCRKVPRKAPGTARLARPGRLLVTEPGAPRPAPQAALVLAWGAEGAALGAHRPGSGGGAAATHRQRLPPGQLDALAAQQLGGRGDQGLEGQGVL